jgi:hypothetical protein
MSGLVIHFTLGNSQAAGNGLGEPARSSTRGISDAALTVLDGLDPRVLTRSAVRSAPAAAGDLR